MARLMGHTVSEFNDRTRTRTEVTAKTRKRCPVCRRMIEVGERAILTDDRRAGEHMGRMTGALTTVVRGAWHLTHPACAEAPAGGES